jgi:hypothetical protein
MTLRSRTLYDEDRAWGHRSAAPGRSSPREHAWWGKRRRLRPEGPLDSLEPRDVKPAATA